MPSPQRRQKEEASAGGHPHLDSRVSAFVRRQRTASKDDVAGVASLQQPSERA
eukprot:CAMPEP_0202957248 /NCGR_PEP_ID=MMETSP1396-20130829/1680_1 /ASSEMBLY_ACC=CAM_ASM_000872 /TAXON_ID= /ORGANISM="Pseudokeronopsis sp., Strain Brazil" /LENGTH=52 /DNA_ID=CAMNT_0049674643 /DNA_START=1 /DNA_END=159 /DNA_ORIENTATION=-